MSKSRCILCFIKKATSKGRLTVNLIDKRPRAGLCDYCKTVPTVAKYSDWEARNDIKNRIYGITITMKPEVLRYTIYEIHKMLQYCIKKVLRNRKTPATVHLWAEMSPLNNHLHYHGWLCLRPAVMHEINNMFKRVYGFIKISNIEDLDLWERYCKKQQEDDDLGLEPIHLTS